MKQPLKFLVLALLMSGCSVIQEVADSRPVATRDFREYKQEQSKRDTAQWQEINKLLWCLGAGTAVAGGGGGLIWRKLRRNGNGI